MANTVLPLFHITDKMMISYQKKKEHEFITKGGIRERTTAAHLSYRNRQKEITTSQQKETARLKQETTTLRERILKFESNSKG